MSGFTSDVVVHFTVFLVFLYVVVFQIYSSILQCFWCLCGRSCFRVLLKINVSCLKLCYC